jgi:hypothetical protein
MPDAMSNGNFAPYLAQAFTPQGIAPGLFGSGVANVPGNMFNHPSLGQNLGQPQVGMVGGVPPFTAMPQLGQPFYQPYTSWQQQLTPQLALANVLGQLTGPGGATLSWPYGSYGYGQLGQPHLQPYTGWQQLMPQFALANPLGQLTGPGGVAIGWPYGQIQQGQNLAQAAEILARVLPFVGAFPLGQSFVQPYSLWQQAAPQLAHALGQFGVPGGAAIGWPYGQVQPGQDIARTAEILARTLPFVGAHQFGQPYIGWQSPQIPQLPVTNLPGQLAGPGSWQQYQQQLPLPVALSPFGAMIGGQYGQGFSGPFGAPSGDMLGRILPYIAQQALAGQGYGIRA